MGQRQGMRCYYSGLPFHLVGGLAHDLYPSLDRQDSDGDYSASNCRLTAWFINRARGRTPPLVFMERLRETTESFASAPCHTEPHTQFQLEPSAPEADPRQIPLFWRQGEWPASLDSPVRIT